jgi:ATP-dependent protease ClpP protease subunit
MSKKQLPLLTQAKFNSAKNRIHESILARWDKTLVKAEDKDNVINVFDVIGADYFGEGFTAKRMSGALRSIGNDKDVVVNINSPGGDFFEGATIYNLLAEHKGKVTVNVMGLAASAASVIAMAGDTIKISQVGFLMIHNAWGMVVGNRHDMSNAADTFGVFDSSMRDLYAARTGRDAKDVEKLMDKETWLNAQDAVDQGFAEEIINIKTADNAGDEKKAKAMARRTIEMALALHGLSRKEREEVFNRAGMRDAADPAAREAGAEDWTAEEVNGLIQAMKN